MPKSISDALKSHLAGSVTSLCTCWLVTRIDGTMIACTDHDSDLVIGGQTYRAATGYTRTAVSSGAGLAVDNMDIVGLLDSSEITETALRSGLFDYATVQIFMVNWANLSQGILKLRSGWLGEVIVTPTGAFRTEIRGLTQALTNLIGENFMPLCRADLGDSRCKVDIDSYSGTGAVTSVTDKSSFIASGVSYTPSADESRAVVTFTGTATPILGITVTIGSRAPTFVVDEPYNSTDLVKWLATQVNSTTGLGATATEQFTTQNVHSVTITKTDPYASGSITKSNDINNVAQIVNFAGATIIGDAYLAGGLVKWLTGSNAGISMEIKSFVIASGALQLFLDMQLPIQVGDTFTYWPGCDKRRETCFFRYNNMNNFRGEPDLPGTDEMLKYPDA